MGAHDHLKIFAAHEGKDNCVLRTKVMIEIELPLANVILDANADRFKIGRLQRMHVRIFDMNKVALGERLQGILDGFDIIADRRRQLLFGRDQLGKTGCGTVEQV